MSMRGHKNAEQEQDQAEVEDTYEYCACKRKTAESGERGEWREGAENVCS